MPILQTNRLPDYQDLDLGFQANPVTKDVPVLIGIEAIKRSMKNLILTNFWERPFRSYIGSNVTRQLFENINSLSANVLQSTITEVIKNFEPRVQLITLIVKISADNNGFIVSMKYKINNRLEPISQTIILSRAR